jgi:6-phosphogluconolactonase
MVRFPNARTLAAALLAAACSSAAAQRTVPVFLGCEARGDAAGIYLAELDVEAGTLTEPRQAAKLPNAGFLALHPGRRFLYATTRLGDREPDGGVAAFAIGEGGRLAPLGQQGSGGAGPCHLDVDGTGRVLLVANYGSGTVAALAIGADGTLAAPASVHQHEGASVHERRQRGPHAHAIHAGPGNGLAYAADLGIDQVRIYRLDTERAVLKPAGHAALPAGSGPRHLKFGRDGRYCYVVNELLRTVACFARDDETGQLSLLQVAATLPDGTDLDDMTCSEIQVHGNGRTVYCANRDHTEQGRDSLTVFAVGADGALERVQTVAAAVRIPRHFALDPSGRWLLVAGQQSGAIAVFAVDAARGTLESTGKRVAMPAPMCVLFVPEG